MKSPTITAAAPPTRNQIDRSVGLPVNVRETSELNEWDSLNPKINSTTPKASIASPMMLFIDHHVPGILSLHWGLYLNRGRNCPVKSAAGGGVSAREVRGFEVRFQRTNSRRPLVIRYQPGRGRVGCERFANAGPREGQW